MDRLPSHGADILAAGAALDDVFARAPIGLGILDAQLRYVSVNAALAEMNGRSAEEHRGRSIREILPGAADMLEPVLRDVLDGRPLLDVELQDPVSLRMFRVSYIPIRPGGGEPAGIAALVADTTDTRKVERALWLTQERLELALEGTQTGTFEWDVATNDVKWSDNLAPLFGRPRGWTPQTYEQYLETLHPDDRPELQEAVRLAIEEGTDYELEHRGLLPDGSVRWLASRVHVITGADGKPAALAGLVTDMTERRHRDEQRDFLARAAVVLNESLDLEATLQHVADLVVPELAAGCEVVLEGDATGRASAGLGPGRAPTEFPIVARGRTIGTIRVGDGTGERTEGLATALGERAGIALENALLHRAQSEANHRLRQLQTVMDVALDNLGLEDLLRELLARVRELSGMDFSAILLHDTERQELRVWAADGVPEELWRSVRLRRGEGLAGRVLESGVPEAVEDVAAEELGTANGLAGRAQSVLSVPLRARDEIVGVLQVGDTVRKRSFGDDDIQLIELVADRAARAIQHAAIYEQARDTAQTLQRSLLPQSLPRIPGFEVQALYRPGQDGAEVGGDFYDVFELPDGSGYAIAVGDVVGRGIPAAALMGQLRAATIAYAIEHLDPAATLSRLDVLVQKVIRVEFATLALLVLDPATGVLRACSAGHPPPVLRRADGETTLAQVGAGAPLGAPPVRRSSSEVRLEVGDAILLYTDGLAERRTASLDDQLAALCAAVREAPPEAGPMLDHVAAVMLHDAGADDTAAVVVRRVG